MSLKVVLAWLHVAVVLGLFDSEIAVGIHFIEWEFGFATGNGCFILDLGPLAISHVRGAE